MKLQDERGLTLVELLVVIVLIGLIGTVVIKNVISSGENAKAELNVVRMEKVKSALGQYRLKYNSYPSKLEELVKGGSEIKESGKLFIPLVGKEELNDIWNFPYVYKTENNGRTFSLKSLGSDGTNGGEGARQDVTIKP